MTILEVESKLTKIIIDKLGVDDKYVTPTAHLTDDLAADSLDRVELLMEAEKEFDISIPDETVENVNSIADAIESYIDHFPRKAFELIETRILYFKFHEDGKIEARLKFEDGSWYYADGSKKLPSNICVLAFNKWNHVLNELEEIINDPNTKEEELQKFFESYPELIAGNDYDVVIPQASIINDDESVNWNADFVMTPKNQFEFAKIVELKLPDVNLLNKPKSGHASFSAKLWKAIMQVRDYGKAFDSKHVRERFKKKYDLEMYKPDLHLIAGRKWDIKLMNSMKSLLRETPVAIENWDNVLDRLRRNYT